MHICADTRARCFPHAASTHVHPPAPLAPSFGSAISWNPRNRVPTPNPNPTEPSKPRAIHTQLTRAKAAPGPPNPPQSSPPRAANSGRPGEAPYIIDVSLELIDDGQPGEGLHISILQRALPMMSAR
eukprot:1161489-Pelagomonas_calceolata.AAC.7